MVFLIKNLFYFVIIYSLSLRGFGVLGRALAGAVWPHDGVDFTGPDDEVDALEDFLFLHTGVEILDGEDGLVHGTCLSSL